MKQLKAICSQRIGRMENIISEYENIENQRANAYVKVVRIVQNLNGSCITCDSGLISINVNI